MTPFDRLSSDVSQLTKRQDDFAMRLAIVETIQKTQDEKLDEIKDTLQWISRWLATLVIGGLLAALLNFIYNGGLASVAKAAGGF